MGLGFGSCQARPFSPPEKVLPTQVHGSLQKAHLPVPRMQPKRQPRFTPSRTQNLDLADALKRSLPRKTLPNRVLSLQTPVAPFHDPTCLAIYSQFVPPRRAHTRVFVRVHTLSTGAVSPFCREYQQSCGTSPWKPASPSLGPLRCGIHHLEGGRGLVRHLIEHNVPS